MKVAIVHYWLVSMRGGEKVVEALCKIYPDADIFTLVVDRSVLSERLKRHRITPSILQRIPGARRFYTSLLPLFPYALEHLDLTGYDLVISSESGPAKAVVAPPDAVHVCYCHSPMRYLWDQYHLYGRQAGALTRLVLFLTAPSLRRWDVTSAVRVDRFVANSHHVANRIARYWGRPADVVHPPVAVDDFAPVEGPKEFYLCAGQLVGYKRIDIAVEAFARSGRRLVVIGQGPEEKRLRRMAGPSVTFLGHQPFSVLKDHLARCRALVFPGEEDFGIVPVEAMASGRPVIAYGRGGALETVQDGVNGILFPAQTVAALEAALARFEAGPAFDVAAIVRSARRFDETVFETRMRAVIDAAIATHYSRRPAAAAEGGTPA